MQTSFAGPLDVRQRTGTFPVTSEDFPELACLSLYSRYGLLYKLNSYRRIQSCALTISRPPFPTDQKERKKFLM